MKDFYYNGLKYEPGVYCIEAQNKKFFMLIKDASDVIAMDAFREGAEHIYCNNDYGTFHKCGMVFAIESLCKELKQ